MAQSTVYVGERGEDGVGRVFIEEERDGRSYRFELPHIVKHSPTGLEWGYGGSGPADLAHSILAHVLQMEKVSARLYQTFKFDVVSRLDQGGFRLSLDAVREWLNTRWASMDQEGIREDLRAA